MESRVHRSSRKDKDGYYRALTEVDLRETPAAKTSSFLEFDTEQLPEGIYSVERVVARRERKAVSEMSLSIT